MSSFFTKKHWLFFISLAVLLCIIFDCIVLFYSPKKLSPQKNSNKNDLQEKSENIQDVNSQGELSKRIALHLQSDLPSLLKNNIMSNITKDNFPSVNDFLPQLLSDPSSLIPRYMKSKGRSDVSIVLGIPTVKREKQSYLISTLRNLVDSVNSTEISDTLIVVLIAEVRKSFSKF